MKDKYGNHKLDKPITIINIYPHYYDGIDFMGHKSIIRILCCWCGTSLDFQMSTYHELLILALVLIYDMIRINNERNGIIQAKTMRSSN